MRFFLLLTFLFSLPIYMNAQFGVGQWRDHLSYENCIDLADGGEVVFAATAEAVFSFNPSDNSMERLSKVNKLSDTGISAIGYDLNKEVLVVGYVNGNLDLVFSGKTFNLPDIKRSSLLADKTIHDIYFKGDKAYLSCGFGVVVIDLIKIEVSDTYMLGPGGDPIQVYNLKDDGEKFWVCTESGIYSADLTNPFLGNFQNWSKLQDIPFPDSSYSDVEINNDYYVIMRDTADVNYIYFRDRATGSSWDLFPSYQGEWIRDLFMDDEQLLLCTYGVFKAYNMDLEQVRVLGQLAGVDTRANALIRTSKSWVFLANEKGGLTGYDPFGKPAHAKPDGPLHPELRRLDSFNDNLWVASGSVDAAWTSGWKSYGIYSLSNNQWTNIPLYNGAGLFDYMDVSINPVDNSEIYLGSWIYGLVHVKNKEIVEVFDETNSSLTVAHFGGIDRVAVGGVDFDPDGNLWFTNNQTDTPLHVRTASGEFQAFDFTPQVRFDDLVTEVLATRQGYVWMLMPGGGGVLVLDHKGTLLDTSDDEYVVLNNEEGTGGLPVEWVNCLEEDLDGEIWVGTLQGPAIFYSPEAIFNGDSFDAQQILIEQDGNVQILLETENINSIEIDGANRKWIGTQHSGAFLMSADGITQIHHFNAENSPMLSNNVLDISINHNNGEVFFGTDKGIISYRADATNFYEEMDQVSVFPNPVRPGFEGLITIDGLSKDADVKIADVSGNVVYQTRANGGRATWNGKRFDGARVSTGVYLVFVTTDDGNSTTVSKIAFVN